jgi:hypothetical protein
MAIVVELSPLNFVHIVGYSGVYSGSQGSFDSNSTLTGVNVSFINDVALDTTVNISSGYNLYFKMQGYNPITQEYEDWHSMREPLMSPPSGNALENISVVGSWIDR